MFGFLAKKIDHDMDAVVEGFEDKKDFSKLTNLIGSILVATIAIVFFGFLIIYSGRKISPPEYFIVNHNKEVSRIQVLANPPISVDKVSQWTSISLQKIFDLEFGKVDAKINDSKILFTDEAWSDFKDSMYGTEMYKEIEEQRLFVNLTPLETPQVVGRGEIFGEIVLVVEVKVMMTYIGGVEPVSKEYLMEVYLKAVPPEESSEGLKIARMIPHKI